MTVTIFKSLYVTWEYRDCVSGMTIVNYAIAQGSSSARGGGSSESCGREPRVSVLVFDVYLVCRVLQYKQHCWLLFYSLGVLNKWNS